MKLLFERSRPGRGSVLLPPCDVPEVTYDQALLRGQAPACRRSPRWTWAGTTPSWPSRPTG